MTMNEFCRKIGLTVPQDPIVRDSHLFELLAMRTRESDEELRSKYANAPESASKSNGAEPKKPQ